MISAKIIADSISPEGHRLTTFELEYHRFVHGELMTHRMFSRNAASSRAIPTKAMIAQVLENPAIPVYWGLNQSGMQAAGEHTYPSTCEFVWKTCANSAVKSAKMLQALGLHKQLVNRVLEPFQTMKTIVTATTFENFFWLRCHKDAQPEIHTLAEDHMYALYKDSKPVLLEAGEYHLPYVDLRLDYNKENWAIVKASEKACGYTRYNDVLVQTVALHASGITLEEAQKVSASCCAQVSYRKLDDSLDKALGIYDDLVDNEPVHASPFEHIGTPMDAPNCVKAGPDGMRERWQDGVTHMDREGDLWSGNLKGWIQYRHTLDNNTVYEYNPHT